MNHQNSEMKLLYEYNYKKNISIEIEDLRGFKYLDSLSELTPKILIYKLKVNVIKDLKNNSKFCQQLNQALSQNKIKRLELIYPELINLDDFEYLIELSVTFGSTKEAKFIRKHKEQLKLRKLKLIGFDQKKHEGILREFKEVFHLSI